MSVVSSVLWDQAIEALRAELDDENFSTWVEPIRYHDFADGQMTLLVPSVFFRRWLIKNYHETIESLLRRLAGKVITVRYLIAPEEGLEDDSEAEREGARNGAALPESGHAHSPNGTMMNGNGIGGAGLNGGGAQAHPRPAVIAGAFSTNRFSPDFTFENYVVGESNRFAHAAAQAAADPSSQSYNPLFIYGASGLGKTHLLQAIGHQFMSYGDHLSVLYVSSETFMNAFIEGIQKRDLSFFRNCFRTVDLLLIDDVQFFAASERTQAEFFHTFNDLTQAGKKIAVTSDRPPRELPELTERLRSRLESGLMVDIQPPDLETRVAILRRKAREMGLTLNPEIEVYIAERIKTSIRPIEGALTKIEAHHALTGEPVTPDLVRSLLGPLLSAEEPIRIDIERIQLTVCKFFDISIQDLTGQARARKYSGPRQIACYLAREMTGLSFPEIARKFGGRDHTSIMAAHRKVQQDMADDLSKQNLIKYLTKIAKDNPMGLPS